MKEIEQLHAYLIARLKYLIDETSSLLAQEIMDSLEYEQIQGRKLEIHRMLGNIEAILDNHIE